MCGSQKWQLECRMVGQVRMLGRGVGNVHVDVVGEWELWEFG